MIAKTMLPHKFFHMVEAIVYIAKSVDAVPGAEIASHQQCTPRYLEKELRQLASVGILKGSKGPNGGYTLAKERRRVTLYDVWLALKEMEDAPQRGPQQMPVTTYLQNHLQQMMIESFKTATIEQLIETAQTNADNPAQQKNFMI